MSNPIVKGERFGTCMLKVTEIFDSIDGEGSRAGYPVTFIRLHGCNLHCSYCDSRYSCDGDDYIERSIYEILDIVEFLKHKRITLTGGEPLMQDNAKYLIKALAMQGYEVNVETNGTILPTMRYEGNVFYTMDFKCASSQMSAFMNKEALESLGSKDVLKFVVGSQDDLKQAMKVIGTIKPRAQIFFSPVFGKIEPREIVAFMLENHLDNCRVQLQLHKYIWDPNKRGV